MSPLTLPRAPPGDPVLVLLSWSWALRSPMRSPPLGASSVLLRSRTGLRPAPSAPPDCLMDSRRPWLPAAAEVAGELGRGRGVVGGGGGGGVDEVEDEGAECKGGGGGGAIGAEGGEEGKGV